MQHTPAKTKVFRSENYNLFTMVDGNRPINKKKVKRIIEEINSGNDILDEVPVLVKENKNKLQVLDGQHRLEVARQLGRPVHYIIHKEDMSMHNVAKVNSNQEKWTDADFINCYAKAGIADYKTLKNFKEKYSLATSLCLMLLVKGKIENSGGNFYEKTRLQFEQGIFKIEKLKEASIFVEICKSFSASKVWNGRPFMIAIAKILAAEKADMDVLVKKFNQEPSRLQNHANWKSYLTNLEEIYNIGNSKRRTIF